MGFGESVKLAKNQITSTSINANTRALISLLTYKIHSTYGFFVYYCGINHEMINASFFIYVSMTINIFLCVYFHKIYRCGSRAKLTVAVLLFCLSFLWSEIGLYTIHYKSQNQTKCQLYTVFLYLTNSFLFSFAQNVALAMVLKVKFVMVHAMFFVNALAEFIPQFMLLRTTNEITALFFSGQYESFAGNMSLLIIATYSSALRNLFSGHMRIKTKPIKEVDIMIINTAITIKCVVSFVVTLCFMSWTLSSSLLMVYFVALGTAFLVVAYKQKNKISTNDIQTVNNLMLINQIPLIFTEVFGVFAGTRLSLLIYFIVVGKQAMSIGTLFIKDKLFNRWSKRTINIFLYLNGGIILAAVLIWYMIAFAQQGISMDYI